ncbi:hypothetical protein [Carnobacterium sp.]|uniref:hypothetical protein n=1 Tax=Carnobacterium TaxID=2747 RepID=UPI002FC8EF1A
MKLKFTIIFYVFLFGIFMMESIPAKIEDAQINVNNSLSEADSNKKAKEKEYKNNLVPITSGEWLLLVIFIVWFVSFLLLYLFNISSHVLK